LAGDTVIAEAVAHAVEQLAGTGRVLLRPSGTEPMVRVMVEAADHATAQKTAEELVEIVRTQLATV
jgi:phosphoglucosamine mutase